MLVEMLGCPEDMLEIEGFCDNEDTIKALEYTKTFFKGNRIGLEVAKLKEMRDRGEVKSISWIPGTFQLADCLTKEGSSPLPLLEAAQKGRFLN